MIYIEMSQGNSFSNMKLTTLFKTNNIDQAFWAWKRTMGKINFPCIITMTSDDSINLQNMYLAYANFKEI